jgi:glycosyltransferase involved in cell wall biosynthesis
METSTPSNKFRILFVSHTAELNGAERMLLSILRELDRRTFTPFLAIPRPGPLALEAEEAGVPTAVVPMKWWLTDGRRAWKQPLAWLWNLPAVFKLKEIIREKGISLVCSNSAAAVGGALAARRARRPHVWIVHEILSGKRPLLRYFLGNKRLVRMIRRRSRAVVVNSSASGLAFGDAGKFEVVLNGVAFPAGAGGRARDPRLGQKLGLKKGDRVVGVVGKIAPEKGQLELIRAFGLACQKVKGLKLLVVGAAADSRYLAVLKREVERLGLEDRVVFAGFVSDAFEALRLMDVLTSASRIESFGRTIIEAMAAGVPVLAVRTGGISEIVRHGKNGFLIESGEPQEMAAAIEKFFALGKAGKEAMVRAGRRTVEERFRIEPQVRKLERIFKDVLKEAAKERPVRA